MAEAAHTSGPWEAIPPPKAGKHWKVGARGVLGGKGSLAGASVLWNVAMIDNGAPGDTLDTEEANARLIAAAPDLLAALKRVVAVADRQTDEFEAARAAIAKAEGKA